jgi:phospholipase C
VRAPQLSGFALLSLFPLLPLTLAACSSSASAPASPSDAADTGVEDTAEPEDMGPPAPAAWDRAVTPPSDGDASKQRESCGYKVGALAGETLGASAPTGAAIPIDHVVIVMQENRSFDHYFWKLAKHGHPDAEVAPDGWTNPDLDGTPVAPFRDTQLCFLDTAHSWNAAHTEWDAAKMDGFIPANEQKGTPPAHATAQMMRGTRAMAYYEPEDLPFMYWAADQFAIGDHYHCSVLTSTWTNRMYLYAANSFGRISNSLPDPKSALTIFDELQMRRVPWKVYFTDTPPEAMFAGSYLSYKDFHYTAIDQLYADAKAGTLPAVSFVDASNGDQVSGFTETQDDEHPPAVMQVGQAFLARVTKALMASPQWGRTALFITYDEHGGLWDHVPPPSACPPDSTPPMLTAGDAPGGYDRLGVRVPFVVISPWAKKGFIGHQIYDHSSIARFVEARFALPAMSNRDANAAAPFEMFDFAKARTDAPAVPDVPIDQAALARCKATLN